MLESYSSGTAHIPHLERIPKSPEVSEVLDQIRVKLHLKESESTDITKIEYIGQQENQESDAYAITLEDGKTLVIKVPKDRFLFSTYDFAFRAAEMEQKKHMEKARNLGDNVLPTWHIITEIDGRYGIVHVQRFQEGVSLYDYVFPDGVFDSIKLLGILKQLQKITHENREKFLDMDLGMLNPNLIESGDLNRIAKQIEQSEDTTGTNLLVDKNDRILYFDSTRIEPMHIR